MGRTVTRYQFGWGDTSANLVCETVVPNFILFKGDTYMSTRTYRGVMNSRATNQTEVIPGREKDMKLNNAGGYSFAIDIWSQLDRFLIIGTDGGSYYVSEQKMTQDNAQNVIAAIKADGVRVVNRIVEISKAGRAPKNDPALFALALVMTYGDDAAKNAAYGALSQVARIGTHLLHLAAYVHDMRGWGRGLRKAFGNWYNNKEPLALAQQLVKYANRDGWTHMDVLRLSHPKPATEDHRSLMQMVVGKDEEISYLSNDVSEYLSAVTELKAATDAKIAIELIEKHKLPREVVPTELLNDAKIWEALLPHMGMEAMVRNLATMTRVGLIGPLKEGTREVLDKLGDEAVILKSKIHPIKMLAALLTYQAGHGTRGNHVWTPNCSIVDALDEAFYTAFGNILPTGQNLVLGIDVSGSMSCEDVAGVIGLSPRVAAAAMAMVTARVEKNYEMFGFSTTFVPLGITSKMRLDEVITKMDNLPFSGTDCAIPMIWAKKNKAEVDGFIVYTDSETYFGGMHPTQALAEYRKASGRNARSAVVGMTATSFSIADPKDKGQLDVVGFDTATPQIISDFIAGNL